LRHYLDQNDFFYFIYDGKVTEKKWIAQGIVKICAWVAEILTR